MNADGNKIEYTSKDGYTGTLFGVASLSISKDGKEVFHTANRVIETVGELKMFVDSFPAFKAMMTQKEPKELVAQVGDFKRDFMNHFEQIPSLVYCTRRTLRMMEREVKQHFPMYITGNPSPSVHGMIVRAVEENEIILSTREGVFSRYRLFTKEDAEAQAALLDGVLEPPRRALFSERQRRAGTGDAE